MSSAEKTVKYKMLRDIKRIGRLQTNLFNLESHKFGLTNGEYSFLFSILNNPGITLKELSEYLISDKSITTKIVNKLLENNFIEKRKNIDDKRSYQLYFNKEKIEFIESLGEVALNYSDKLLNGFSKEEKMLFENFLDRSFINVSKKY